MTMREMLQEINNEMLQTIEKENKGRYVRLDMTAEELLVLFDLSKSDPIKAIRIGYDYGFARGKRSERNRRKKPKSKRS